MDSSKTILKLKGKLFVERKCFINQKSKLKFFGAPTVFRASVASVASVASIASTSTVATSSSFTASSFNRRNRRRLGKFLGGLKNKETYPSPHNGWWFLLAFRSLRLQSVCVVCFCSSFPGWQGIVSTKASLVQLRLLLPSVHRQFFDLEAAPSKQQWRNPFLVVMCLLEGRL